MRKWKGPVGLLLLFVFVFSFAVAVESAFATWGECECTFYCPYQGRVIGGEWRYYPEPIGKVCSSSQLNLNCVCYME